MTQTLLPHNTEQSNLLLVVEDNEQDYEMFQRSVKRSNIQCQLHRFETGDDALQYLVNRDNYTDSLAFKKPALILLDLNLPGTDGHTVLKTLKLDASLKLIPIVIFSTSSNPKDLESCYKNGANGYVVKPLEASAFHENIKVLLQYWLEVNRQIL
jgi:CheY-like chemotaxis protein